MFIYKPRGCGFNHINYRFCACSEEEVPWHSGNYRVWIHSETRTWHDKNIQSVRSCVFWLRFLQIAIIMFKILLSLFLASWFHGLIFSYLQMTCRPFYDVKLLPYTKFFIFEKCLEKFAKISNLLTNWYMLMLVENSKLG